MTYDNEAIVRHAYHTAEGSVLDIAGFVGSFAEDGVINMGTPADATIARTAATLERL